jgi:DNA helicase-2/ATP-dependent DNA helicase PcrA
MTGGESLWRAQWSERANPFAHVERGTGRGLGWQRASTLGEPAARSGNGARVVEVKASAASFAAKPRSDITVGQRVFHSKFGYGAVLGIEGNKLAIAFEQSGTKHVLDSFVTPA